MPPSDQQSAGSDRQGLSVEPAPAPTGAAAPVPPPNFDTKKTPQQRSAEAQVVKQMMRGDNTNNQQEIRPSPITELQNMSGDAITIAEVINTYSKDANNKNDPTLNRQTLIKIQSLSGMLVIKLKEIPR